MSEPKITFSNNNNINNNNDEKCKRPKTILNGKKHIMFGETFNPVKLYMFYDIRVYNKNKYINHSYNVYNTFDKNNKLLDLDPSVVLYGNLVEKTENLLKLYYKNHNEHFVIPYVYKDANLIDLIEDEQIIFVRLLPNEYYNNNFEDETQLMGGETITTSTTAAQSFATNEFIDWKTINYLNSPYVSNYNNELDHRIYAIEKSSIYKIEYLLPYNWENRNYHVPKTPSNLYEISGSETENVPKYYDNREFLLFDNQNFITTSEFNNLVKFSIEFIKTITEFVDIIETHKNVYTTLMQIDLNYFRELQIKMQEINKQLEEEEKQRQQQQNELVVVKKQRGRKRKIFFPENINASMLPVYFYAKLEDFIIIWKFFKHQFDYFIEQNVLKTQSIGIFYLTPDEFAVKAESFILKEQQKYYTNEYVEGNINYLYNYKIGLYEKMKIPALDSEDWQRYIVNIVAQPLQSYIIHYFNNNNSTIFNNKWINYRKKNLYDKAAYLTEEQYIQLIDAYYWCHMNTQQPIESYQKILNFYNENGIVVRLKHPYLRTGKHRGRGKGPLRNFCEKKKKKYLLPSKYVTYDENGNAHSLFNHPNAKSKSKYLNVKRIDGKQNPFKYNIFDFTKKSKIIFEKKSCEIDKNDKLVYDNDNNDQQQNSTEDEEEDKIIIVKTKKNQHFENNIEHFSEFSSIVNSALENEQIKTVWEQSNKKNIYDDDDNSDNNNNDDLLDEKQNKKLFEEFDNNNTFEDDIKIRHYYQHDNDVRLYIPTTKLINQEEELEYNEFQQQEINYKNNDNDDNDNDNNNNNDDNDNKQVKYEKKKSVYKKYQKKLKKKLKKKNVTSPPLTPLTPLIQLADNNKVLLKKIELDDDYRKPCIMNLNSEDAFIRYENKKKRKFYHLPLLPIN